MDKNVILERLEKVRSRIVLCLLIMSLGFAGSYAFSERILAFIMRPLTGVMPPGERAVFTWLPEAFFCHLKAALGVGILLALPAVMYTIWSIFAPRHGMKGKLTPVLVVSLSTLLFFVGASFCYFVVMPFAFKYLIGLAPESVRPLPSLGEYFGLACWLLFAFGAVFELPLVVSILSYIGIVTPAFLRKNRKYAFLLSFILAAILTPTPDVFNQLLMAGPLVILYELGILGALIFVPKKPSNLVPALKISG
ncbi:MAG: twin-arginine translocase subunit TatC [Desulfobacteraceae bacterium]|nr:twin-arginine translocase subunit TatC [Desulfobacterales bacterium]MBL6968157.1 twin-arginine translocase subunit TatC [Desulfobacteraceae bacterium]MBL7172289.1 twin-arginine translocase subunit TatC [Desulfobacteraceae bacterium]MBU0734770.1 twin-arginine translocase subunit TatC [Pseudomonadota bacterium]